MVNTVTIRKSLDGNKKSSNENQNCFNIHILCISNVDPANIYVGMWGLVNDIVFGDGEWFK